MDLTEVAAWRGKLARVWGSEKCGASSSPQEARAGAGERRVCGVGGGKQCGFGGRARRSVPLRLWIWRRMVKVEFGGACREGLTSDVGWRGR